MEKVRRNKSSKHNLYLGFKYRWQPRSIEPRPLVFKYSYNNANTRYKVTPIRIPMIAWNKNKQQIKNEYQKEYKEYVTLINQYKSQFHSLKLQLTDNKLGYADAFNKLLNIVEDGYILDKFATFCKMDKRSNSAIEKQTSRINALHSFFNDIGEIEYNRLKWSHVTQDKHIRKIETLINDKHTAKNETKNAYLDALNYAVKVNPNLSIEKTFTDKFEVSEEVEEDKYLERSALDTGIIKIGNNLQWLEAYLFWLLSFSLRGLDGADICLMSDSWLCDEKGRKVKSEDVKHYLPNYNELVNRSGLHTIKLKDKRIEDMLPKFKKTNKKVYIKGYRVKSDVGIKILFNHYPTLIIHRLLKTCIGFNRPHLLNKGEDRLKLYNIDYHTDKGKRVWKNLLNTYTKQCQKMFGKNGKMKHVRHTFTNELGQILGRQQDKMLSVSLGHRTKRTSDHYVKQDQTKLDIFHMEVIKSYEINRILKLIIQKCSKTDFEYKGRQIKMIRTEGVMPIVDKYEIEALDIPLTYWSPMKEYEYQRLMKKENNSKLIGFNEDGEAIYQQPEFSKELQDLIKERKQQISQKKIKRHTLNYSSKTGVVNKL